MQQHMQPAATHPACSNTCSNMQQHMQQHMQHTKHAATFVCKPLLHVQRLCDVPLPSWILKAPVQHLVKGCG
eukprot:10576502-Alexandrium_andersonii.AAC.1